jgi:hypothetical protein
MTQMPLRRPSIGVAAGSRYGTTWLRWPKPSELSIR